MVHVNALRQCQSAADYCTSTFTWTIVRLLHFPQAFCGCGGGRGHVVLQYRKLDFGISVTAHVFKYPIVSGPQMRNRNPNSSVLFAACIAVILQFNFYVESATAEAANGSQTAPMIAAFAVLPCSALAATPVAGEARFSNPPKHSFFGSREIQNESISKRMSRSIRIVAPLLSTGFRKCDQYGYGRYSPPREEGNT